MSATAEALTEPAADALLRAQRGDHEAFADLVRGHDAMVFSVALHFLRDRARAEELAQEVFLQLYRHLFAIESPRHLQFWLRKAITRRCIDEVRRRPIRAVPLDEVAEAQAVPDSGDPLLKGMLRALVGELRPAQRLVVTLRYQEELEPAEIAAVLGMRLQTVKSQLHRALRTLRKRIAEENAARESRRRA